mmetsp:Transcript_35096/g.88264  ORF Transcript_35096/g.88264 Transcript_35096/m.88264 type:complete len:561 (-) Transcript_35096:179-1861(-)
MIREWEAHRAQHACRVPFYIHEVPALNLSEVLSNVGECIARAPGVSHLQHSGEYYFLRDLSTHRWRVPSPAAASLIILPFLPMFELRDLCEGYSTASVQRQILQTQAWRDRRADHLLLSTDPSLDRWDELYSVAPRTFFPSEPLYSKPTKPAGGKLAWTRPNASTRALLIRRQQQQERYQSLLATFETTSVRAPHFSFAAPYANRPSTASSERAANNPRRHRPLSFVFGGQTSRARHKSGNYARWALFEAGSASLPEATLLVASDNATTAAAGNAPRRGLRKCDWRARLLEGTTGSPHRSESHQCWGAFDTASLLLRAEFALAPRGDTASSRRLVDAMQYGALPVIISDSFFQVAGPFQCWVPYDLFVVQLRELDILRAPAAMLHHVARTLGATQRLRMRTLLQHFRRDLLWDVRESRVAENVLLAAEAARASQRGASVCCMLPDRTCVMEPLIELASEHKRSRCPQQGRADRVLASTRCVRPTSCHASATNASSAVHWIDANAVIKEKHCANGETRIASSCRVKPEKLPRDGPVDRQVGPVEITFLQTRGNQLVNQTVV